MLVRTINKISTDVVCLPLNLEEYVFLGATGAFEPMMPICLVQVHMRNVVVVGNLERYQELTLIQSLVEIFKRDEADGLELYENALVVDKLPTLIIGENFAHNNVELFALIRKHT